MPCQLIHVGGLCSFPQVGNLFGFDKQFSSPKAALNVEMNPIISAHLRNHIWRIPSTFLNTPGHTVGLLVSKAKVQKWLSAMWLTKTSVWHSGSHGTKGGSMLKKKWTCSCDKKGRNRHLWWIWDKAAEEIWQQNLKSINHHKPAEILYQAQHVSQFIVNTCLIFICVYSINIGHCKWKNIFHVR